MHMIIRAIVYANDKNEALIQAKNVFNSLTENQEPFDYYTLFNNNESQVSGKARWGNLTPVALASSKEGKKLIDGGMKATREAFDMSIKAIREGIEKYTDDQLFENKDVEVGGMRGMFKYFTNIVGKHRGSDIFLYDNDGEGINSNENLKDVLSKWERNGEVDSDYKHLKVFVVPADVHY